ncbi:MAG TPA: phage tail length tape measure family protein [Stenotrophobium sp.]|nr:phage tail length tape measure family protein [Stenotrophobium sp.]
MSVEGENLGVATIYLTVDKTSMDATIGKAKLQLAGMGAEASKQYEAMSASQRKMAEGLVRQAELINKTTAERVAYNAQLKIGGALGDEIAARALANAQATAAAQNEATAAAKAAEAAQAELAAAEDARFKQIAADAMAEVEARQAITAATLEQARANAALAEAQGVGTGGSAAAVGAIGAGALDASIVRQQIADYAALDAIMGKKVATTEEVAAAEAALDRLQQAGMLSNEQLAETFAALETVTAAETKSLQANTVAQVENAAAARMNSRTQYELGIMLGEVASGNIGRLKRSTAALANSTGLLKALMSPTGQSILGVTAILGTFAVAIEKGEEQVSSLNTALLNTGGYAGLAATELIAMGNQIDGTIGHARDAIQALTATGKFSGDQIRQLGQAVVDEMALTGKSVDQVVAEFVKLREDPIRASEQLNEAEHYLTTAILQQIDALQKQGDMEDAARIATDARANALRERAQEMEQNLGALQRVWDSLKSSASFAWDAMLGIGRPTSQLDALDQRYNDLLKEREAAADIAAGRNPSFFAPDVPGVGRPQHSELLGFGYTAEQQQKAASLLPALDAQLDAARAADMAVQKAQDATDAAKQAQAQIQASGQEGIETLDKLGISLDGYKNKQDKVNAAAEAFYKIWLAGGKLPAGMTFAGSATGTPMPQGAAWEKIKDQLLHGTGHHADPAATALATFQSQVASLSDRSLFVDGDAALTKYVQGVAKLNDEFDKAIAKHADLTRAQAAYDAGMKALNRTLDKNEAAQHAQVQEFTNSLNDQLAARKALIDVQLKTMTMGPQEAANYKQLAEVTEQATKAIADFQRQHVLHPEAMSQDEYKAELKALKQYWNDVYDYTEEGQQRVAALQGDFSAGMQAGIDAFIEETNNKFKQGQQFIQDFTSGFADAFVQFATGAESAKKAFGDFIDQLFADALRIEADKFLAKMLKGDGAGGGYQDLFGYGYGGASVENGSSSSGGWFSTLLSAFFGGGKAGGGVVDAGHLYKVNEQGPEMLTVGNVDYLMMGSQRGHVTPNDQSLSRLAPSITIVQNLQPTSTRRTADQVAVATARKLRTVQARTA